MLGIIDMIIIAIYSGYVENKTGYSMIVFYVICVVFLFFIGKNICYIKRILREKWQKGYKGKNFLDLVDASKEKSARMSYDVE